MLLLGRRGGARRCPEASWFHLHAFLTSSRGGLTGKASVSAFLLISLFILTRQCASRHHVLYNPPSKDWLIKHVAWAAALIDKPNLGLAAIYSSLSAGVWGLCTAPTRRPVVNMFSSLVASLENLILPPLWVSRRFLPPAPSWPWQEQTTQRLTERREGDWKLSSFKIYSSHKTMLPLDVLLAKISAETTFYVHRIWFKSLFHQ